MFTKKSVTTAKLDDVIDEALLELKMFNIDAPEYRTALENVERLQQLKEKNRSQPLSRDTLAIVVGNLAGIAMIVGYEHAHVVTSKALAFVMKSK